MFEENSARGRFKTRGECARSFRDIRVDERQSFRLEARDQCVDDEEQLQLRFGHAAECPEQYCEIQLLLPFHGGRGMTLRGR